MGVRLQEYQGALGFGMSGVEMRVLGGRDGGGAAGKGGGGGGEGGRKGGRPDSAAHKCLCQQVSSSSSVAKLVIVLYRHWFVQYHEQELTPR